MASRSRELRVSLTADTKGLARGTAQAQRMFATLEQTSNRASRSMGSSMARTAALLTGGAGVTGGLLAATKAGFAFNAQMESSQLALSRFIGSSKETKRFLDEMFQTAKDSPFEFTQLTEASRRLMAFGLDVEQTKETLVAFGDAIAAAGGGVDKVNRVTTALGQIQAKNKLYMEEILQLQEAGIPATAILQRELKLTGDQMARIGDLGIDAKTAITALTNGVTRDFGGAAQEQSRTFAGMTAKMKDNWAQMTGAMTQGLFQATKKWIPVVNSAMERVAAIFNRRDLDFGEKLVMSRDVLRDKLDPIWQELRAMIERADIPERMAAAFEAAAPRAVSAFITAFQAAGPWGKLFTVGLLASKLGAFSKIGERAAGGFAGGFSGGIGPALDKKGLGSKGKRWSNWGRAAGAAAGIGIVAGIAAEFDNSDTKTFLRKLFENILPISPRGGSGPKGGGTPKAGAWFNRGRGLYFNTPLTDAFKLPPLGAAPVLPGAFNLPKLRSKPWAAGTNGKGELIGTPYQGTHTQGNWQSDNAVDIRVTRGTPILAVEGGKVTKVRVKPDGGGQFAGSQVTIKGASGNSYFYAHLASVSVKAGQKVRSGQQIGTSGVANGVPHLHFGVEKGDPRNLRISGMGGTGGGLAITKLSPQHRTIYAAAKKYGIDPAILWGLYGAESSFGKNTGPSSAGALGPFQLMPGTARELGVDPMNFKDAAYGAARYLARYKNRGTRGMLQAYNAGPYGNPDNPETRAYVQKVLKLAKQFPTLDVGQALSIAPTNTRELNRVIAQARIRPIAQSLRRVINPLAASIGASSRFASRMDDRLQVLGVTAGLADEDIVTPAGRITRWQELTSQRDALIGRGFAHNSQREAIHRAMRHYGRAIKRLRGQYKKAPAGQRPTIKAQIVRYQQRIRELREEARALGVQVQIDAAELKGVMDEVNSFMTNVREAEGDRDLGLIDRDLALAELTPGTDDDRAALVRRVSTAQRLFDVAQKGGDAAKITQFARALKVATDELAEFDKGLQESAAAREQEIIGGNEGRVSSDLNMVALKERAGQLSPEDAKAERQRIIESALGGGYGLLTPEFWLQLKGDLRELFGENTEALRDNTTELKALTDEVKRYNEFAQSVASITSREAIRAFADVISGQIAGHGYAGRALTAGSGTIARY